MATSRIKLNGRTYRDPSSEGGSGILTATCSRLGVSPAQPHVFLLTAIDPDIAGSYYAGLIQWKSGSDANHVDLATSTLKWGASNRQGTVRIDGGNLTLDYSVTIVGGVRPLLKEALAFSRGGARHDEYYQNELHRGWYTRSNERQWLGRSYKICRRKQSHRSSQDLLMGLCRYASERAPWCWIFNEYKYRLGVTSDLWRVFRPEHQNAVQLQGNLDRLENRFHDLIAKEVA